MFGLLSIWDAQYLGCLVFDIWNAQYLGCSAFRMLSVWDVSVQDAQCLVGIQDACFLGCFKFGMAVFWGALCLGCSVFETLCVWGAQCLGCLVFRMPMFGMPAFRMLCIWDVSVQDAQHLGCQCSGCSVFRMLVFEMSIFRMAAFGMLCVQDVWCSGCQYLGSQYLGCQYLGCQNAHGLWQQMEAVGWQMASPSSGSSRMLSAGSSSSVPLQSSAQNSGTGKELIPTLVGRMGARPISGLAMGEEIAGSLDIQAALELGTRGN